MFKHQGIWLPDGEQHFPEWMTKNGEIVDGRGTYQIRKLREAMKHVKQFRVAVDVGAHVGLWSMHLAKRFQRVEAFEPVPAFVECFAKNVLEKNVTLTQCALGDRQGAARLRIDPADSGGTHLIEGPATLGLPGSTRVDTLDAYFEEEAYQASLGGGELPHIDFLKIDCEGYEHHVVAGARETLARCKPCVIVEQKPHKLGPNFGIKGTPAVDLLKGMGATVRDVLSGDYILSW